MTFLIFTLTLATALFPLQQAANPGRGNQAPTNRAEHLEEAVIAYWDALQAKDLATAQTFVRTEDRSSFLRRSLPDFRSWCLEDIQYLGDSVARVRVVFECRLGHDGSYYRVPLAEDWFRQSGEWKLKVAIASPAEANRILYGSSASKQSTGEGVLLHPSRLELHFLNPVQRGNLYIQNGLDEPVRLLRVEINKPGFQILSRPRQIPPGEEEKLVIQYSGNDATKELTASVQLVLRWGGKERIFVRPILYNHLSELIRAFFGLSKEDARRLRRGERLRPAIKYP